MKLDKLLEHLQQQMAGNIENSTSPSTSQQQQTLFSQQPFNFFNYNCSTPTVVPLNEDEVSQGLLAVGGCRQAINIFKIIFKF